MPGRFDAGTININTGIAVANYGFATAHVTYALRDINNVLLSSGSGTIATRTHMGVWLGKLNLDGDNLAKVSHI